MSVDPGGLRRAVRAAVSGRRPVDERERISVELALAELDRLSDPFDEHADPVHVTGSAIVTGERGVVLHRHKRLGIWLQPGGHVDPGETPWAAAAREAVEETGLAVRFAGDERRGIDRPDAAPELVHVDVHSGPRGHTHLDLRYHLLAGDDEPAPSAGESPDVRWFSWAEAIDVADPGLRGALVALRP